MLLVRLFISDRKKSLLQALPHYNVIYLNGLHSYSNSKQQETHSPWHTESPSFPYSTSYTHTRIVLFLPWTSITKPSLWTISATNTYNMFIYNYFMYKINSSFEGSKRFYILKMSYLSGCQKYLQGCKRLGHQIKNYAISPFMYVALKHGKRAMRIALMQLIYFAITYNNLCTFSIPVTLKCLSAKLSINAE